VAGQLASVECGIGKCKQVYGSRITGGVIVTVIIGRTDGQTVTCGIQGKRISKVITVVKPQVNISTACVTITDRPSQGTTAKVGVSESKQVNRT